jgi:hypothetical protein
MAKAKKQIVDTAMIAEWMELQSKLKDIKEKEMALRIKICDTLVPDDNAGTFKFDIGELKVKIAKKFNYNILKKEYDDLADAFNDAEKECVRLKPELNMKKYNAYVALVGTDEELDMDNLHMCIDIKPAAPTLQVGAQDNDEED